MKSFSYSVLGVMSGTSLDGVDLACVRFSYKDNQWAYQLGECQTVPYAEEWKKRLAEGMRLSAPELEELDREYTVYLSEIINKFLTKNSHEQVDWVCSHGHTIHHRPEEKYTLQIGNQPFLADLIHRSVVCDFRVQDVKLGGQGAPLVPIGDQLLFAAYSHCLNLGGFSNVSYEQNGKRVAYDLTPVNVVMNPLAEQLGRAYDENGNWAREGNCIPELLQQLNELPFYTQQGPRSLGMEFVSSAVLPVLKAHTHRPKEVLATWVEHCAYQMAKAFQQPGTTVFVTGGGAYNAYLIERLRFHAPKATFLVPEAKLIEYKEALVFALLGVLRLEGMVNTLASVTGAIADHSAGQVFPYKG